MSIATIIAQVEVAVEPIIAAAKEWAGKAVDYLKDVAISAVQKAVALIKETPLGTAIANLVSAASLSTTTSGADKFSAVLAAVTDAYNAFVGNGGLSGLIASGVSVLRQTIQFVYDEMQQAFFSAKAA